MAESLRRDERDKKEEWDGAEVKPKPIPVNGSLPFLASARTSRLSCGLQKGTNPP
jgi:hypothetical protein